MINTKQKAIVDTQKIMRKESKHATKGSESSREKEQNYKTARKEQNDNKCIPINNDFSPKRKEKKRNFKCK